MKHRGWRELQRQKRRMAALRRTEIFWEEMRDERAAAVGFGNHLHPLFDRAVIFLRG
jgi:hypothetical protein